MALADFTSSGFAAGTFADSSEAKGQVSQQAVGCPSFAQKLDASQLARLALEPRLGNTRSFLSLAFRLPNIKVVDREVKPSELT